MMQWAGRAFQCAGLVVMPSAILAAEMLHSERIAVGLFIGSALIFAAGTFLIKIGKR